MQLPAAPCLCASRCALRHPSWATPSARSIAVSPPCAGVSTAALGSCGKSLARRLAPSRQGGCPRQARTSRSCNLGSTTSSDAGFAAAPGGA
eukprot:7271695-Alexandrium_andersonii.AAC.1